MKYLRSMENNSKGFTLIEIIVTIVAAGILGAIFVNLMGTALNSSWNAVEIVRDESNGEGVMELIIADYVKIINPSPPGDLDTIVQNKDKGDYGSNVTMQYIEFDASGNEIPSALKENLKVVVQASGTGIKAITGRYPLTTILAKSRTASNDQIVIY
jgi:prepilin-type N-terminal cleavage/methylation domain-containing protein